MSRAGAAGAGARGGNRPGKGKGKKPQRAHANVSAKQLLFDQGKLHFCPKGCGNTGDGSSIKRCGNDNGRFSQDEKVTVWPAR